MVQFASYVRRVLHKTRLIFSRINGPNVRYASRRLIFRFASSKIVPLAASCGRLLGGDGNAEES